MPGRFCGGGTGPAPRQRCEWAEAGIHASERLGAGVCEKAAGENGGEGTDRGAIPGTARRALPHLSLPQPGDPGGHGRGPEPVR